jgi:hypothetical protein
MLPNSKPETRNPELVLAHRQRLHCSVPQVDDIFPACLEEATRLLTPQGVEDWLDGASAICGLGRGQELPVIFLENMPRVARIAGERIIAEVVEMARYLSRSGNAQAIAPYLARLPAVTRRLETDELLLFYFDIVRQIAEQAPAGLAPFLDRIDVLLGQICIGSVRNWVDYGLRAYRGQPHKVGDYFGLQAADARAALQRERKGALLADHERKLTLYLRAFWNLEEELQPYSLAFDIERRPQPHLDKQGFHVPDVYEELARADTTEVGGIDRYRAALAHLAAHRLYTKPFIADNFNRYQQILIETFEDARVEYLAMRQYPGLRRLWLALHPQPVEGACPEGHSCIRHKAAMLSRAILDPGHPYADPLLREFAARFLARVERDPHDTAIATELGVDYLVKIHSVDFRSPKVWFRDTEVSYRDDNRYMWIFLEDTDDEDDFHSDHQVANPRERVAESAPQLAWHQPEWDYAAQSYRPDWVTVFESVQPPGDAARIDRLLDKHARLAKQLKRVVDMLKPQQQARVRFQEDGSELDLDIAIRALVDFRSGATPDPRIHFSHTHDGRDISVLLLLDLSQSANAAPPGATSTILELSREAVTLLAWATAALGDPFAIAGFASNTRHDVRHFHFKGFTEPWGDAVKARLSGMQGGLSTRMGAALRHAGHYLSRRASAKKLLLILTDGEPADVDVDDPQHLREDARKAVEELAGKGVATFCMSLDPRADEYVARIFGGNRYLVLDRVEQLPAKLPLLYMGLTR